MGTTNTPMPLALPLTTDERAQLWQLAIRALASSTERVVLLLAEDDEGTVGVAIAPVQHPPAGA